MRTCTTLLVVLGVLRVGASAEREPTLQFVFSEFVLDKRLELLAPTAASIQNELCRTQAVHYEKAVREGVEWAVQMYDSASKTPLSVLSRDGFYLGQYDACLSLEHVQTEAGPITGRHCLVTVGARTWRTHASAYQRMRYHVVEMEDWLTAGRTRGNAGALRVESQRGFVWSLCVPASCESQDVKLHLTTALPRLMNGNAALPVSDVTCTSRADQHSFTARDWLLVCILVVLLNLVTIATVRDFYGEETNRGCTRALLGAFSLRRGARQLLAVTSPRPEDEDRLAVLDGLRVLTMWVLFLYHFEVVLEHSPSSAALGLEDDVWLQRSRFPVSFLHVDTFVFLAALLVSYNQLRAQRNGAKFKLLSFYLRRLIRVAPCFWLAVLALQSNVQYYFGESPVLLATLTDNHRNCADNWPQVMMFLGNFLPPERMCALHSWYLAADMQLYCIAPAFVILLHKHPSIGKATVVCSLALSLTLAYLLTSRWEYFYLGIPSGLNVELSWFTPWLRLTPWLVGLGVGYVLHVTARSQVRLSACQVTAAWIITAVAMSTAFWMGPLVMRWDNPSMTSVFVNLQRPAWALGLAWVVFACSRGYGGPVTRALSWRGFTVPSRLSFAFYLTHVVVIGVSVTRVNTVESVDALGWVVYLLRDLLLSLLTATVLHLVVETPANNLGKILLQDASDVKSLRGKED